MSNLLFSLNTFLLHVVVLDCLLARALTGWRLGLEVLVEWCNVNVMAVCIVISINVLINIHLLSILQLTALMVARTSMRISTLLFSLLHQPLHHALTDIRYSRTTAHVSIH
jgi:hypothetical protein